MVSGWKKNGGNLQMGFVGRSALFHKSIYFNFFFLSSNFRSLSLFRFCIYGGSPFICLLHSFDVSKPERKKEKKKKICNLVVV